MTAVTHLKDLFTRYRAAYADSVLNFDAYHSSDEKDAQEIGQFLEFVRQRQIEESMYEPAYHYLVHQLVLNGSRAKFLRAIARCLETTFESRSSLVLISGVSGIGKTSLAMAHKVKAESSGAAFVVGRCYEQGGTPYWIWQDVVRSLAGLLDRSHDSLPEPFGSAETATSVQQMIQRLADWLSASADEKPLVILLDDLHWADSESLDVLDILTDYVARKPIMFMATYRAEETYLDHALYHYLPRLQRNTQAVALQLGPLTVEDTTRLVMGYYGSCSSELARYLHERAEGHPLFTIELLRDLIEQQALAENEVGQWLPPDQSVPVPTLLKQVILRRASRLGNEAEKLLLAAAVVGTTWPLAVVEPFVDLAEDQLLDVLEKSLKNDLVRIVDDQAEIYRFSHGLIQQVLYQQQLTRRRKRLHAQIASYIETQEPELTPTLAYHFFQAEAWEKAFVYCRDAGDEAQKRFAVRAALNNYQQALVAVQNIRPAAAADNYLAIYERLAHVHMALENKDETVTAYTRMHDIAADTGDIRTQALALAGLTKAYAKLYKFDLAEKTARQALILAEKVADPKLLASVHYSLGYLNVVHGHLTASNFHYIQSEKYARKADVPDILASTLRLQTFEAVFRGDYATAEEYALEALAIAESSRDSSLLDGSLQALSIVQIEWGKYAAAYHTMMRALDRESILGQQQLHNLPRILNQMGYLFLELGDAETALEWDLKALAASRPRNRHTVREMERYSLLNVATDLLYLDQLDEALAYVDEFESIKDMAEFARFRYYNRYQLLMAEISLKQQNYRSAHQYAHDAYQAAVEKNVLKNKAKSLLYMGQAFLGLNQIEEAVGCMQEALQLADVLQHGSLRWKVRYYLEEALATSGRSDPTMRQEVRTILAMIQQELEGSELQSAFGKSGLMKQLLDDTLATPSSVSGQPTFPAGLTAREVEVLRLVAGGATNREVANRLHISVRTVSTHITNILNKTNCDNRTAAAAFARQHNLV